MLYRLWTIGFLLIIVTQNIIYAEQKYSKIEDLSGFWKFNLGDNKIWAEPSFDDSDWDILYVPSPWEDEGYNGFDGYAWYRKEFSISSKYTGEKLYLSLGAIDDVAEIYINGNLIGLAGSFPPSYESAYNNKIWYPLSTKLFNKIGKNLIAVRVYDHGGAGGIYKGDVGIFMSKAPLNLLINLEGKWKFKVGDNQSWSEINFNDNDWTELIVPFYWDNQGYKDYDGFAWYRLKFNFDLNDININDELIIILGKIDDLDETFLNGKYIGSTGDLLIQPLIAKFGDQYNLEYSKMRGYQINKNTLRNGENIIAVRVYDGYQLGGIYEGPIGIANLEEYVRYRTRDLDRKEKSFIELLFDN